MRCCQGRRKRMLLHFNNLKLCPTDVCILSYCPQDASYSSQFDDTASFPVNTETCGSGRQAVLLPDGEERVVNLSVLAAGCASTTDYGYILAAELTESMYISYRVYRGYINY